MKAQLLTMLGMQDELNTVVHPQWRTQGFAWTRAIMVEGVEALEHFGWKWWKEQARDEAQVRLELVDIWHFMMSFLLQDAAVTVDTLADELEAMFAKGAPMYLVHSDRRRCLEMVIGRAAAGELHMAAFLALLEGFNMTFDDLYRLYVAKNVLNMFRQERGYKQGTYIKMWFGQEDNAVLDTLLKLKPDATAKQLNERLAQIYNSVLEGASSAQAVTQ